MNRSALTLVDSEGMLVVHQPVQLPDPVEYELEPGVPMAIGPAQAVTARVDRDAHNGDQMLRLEYRAGWTSGLGEAREFGANHYLGRPYRQALHLATRYLPDGSVRWVRVQIV